MSYLKLENLTKVYGKNGLAVDNFNLEIEKEEFVCFLGPSGCGKSTTLRMIAGLESVTSGEILLDGVSIVKDEPKDRHISMIFQSYAVWPHLSVYDNVAYALKLRKMSKEDIDKTVKEAANITQITEYLDRYPNKLSGGQRQRVAVARAIAIKPKLFLMDEPLSNLDAKLRVSMRTDLKKIHQDLHSTSIFVTHDQSEALSLADRIVVMNKGVIEQVGTPNEIYHDSETMFVAKFIGSPPSNFFKVQVCKTDNQISLKHPSFEYKINAPISKILRDKYVNKEIILAVRPENFVVDPNGIIEVKCLIVEPQGSHLVINVDIGNEAAKVVTNILDIKTNDIIKLNFNINIAFFDLETEHRIR